MPAPPPESFEPKRPAKPPAAGSADNSRPARPNKPTTQHVVDYLVRSLLPNTMSDARLARLLASSLSRPTTPWVAQMRALPVQATVVNAVTWVLSNGDVTIRAVSPPCVSAEVAWGLASAQLMALAHFLRIRRLEVGYPEERLARLAAALEQPEDSASPFWRAVQKLQADLPEVSLYCGTP